MRTLAKALLAAAVASAATTTAAPSFWPGADTTNNVHLFTLWSQEQKNSTLIAMYDYVWAISNVADLERYRSAGAKAGRASPAVLGRYVPFGIAGHGDGAANQNFDNLTWWQTNHPSWLLYQCDRKTPATYWGPGFGLDITNPDVVDWMLHAPASENSLSATAIAAGGYDSISLDLFSFACGRWKDNLTWVDMYTPSGSDPAYKQDVLRWLQQYYAGLATLRRSGDGGGRRRLLLVPNHASHVGQAAAGYWGNDAWNSTDTFLVGNHTDGILSEEGWTGYGGGLVGDLDWTNKQLFQRNLEAQGKAYLSVNYWGPRNVRTHANVTEESYDVVADYFVASYLVNKATHAAVYFGPNQCTQGITKDACNCGSWCSTADTSRLGNVAVGAAEGAGRQLPGSEVWQRYFSSGVAFANPSSTATHSVHLDATHAYKTRHGADVDVSKPLVLPPTTGAVLLYAA